MLTCIIRLSSRNPQPQAFHCHVPDCRSEPRDVIQCKHITQIYIYLYIQTCSYYVPRLYTDDCACGTIHVYNLLHMIQDQNGLSGCIRSVHGFLCLQCGELHAKTFEFLTIQNPTQEETQCYAIQRKEPSGWLCRCIWNTHQS